MLGQQRRRFIHAGAKTCQQAAVAGRNRVVHISHRNLTAQQIQNGKQHRAHGVERVGKGRVGVLGQTYVAKDVHKRAALQKRERVHAAAVEDIEQHVPIRIRERHQAAQRLALAVVKADFVLFTRKAQGVIQKHLVDLDHVTGQLVDKLAAVGGMRTNHPQHKLVLGHSRNVAVHPGRHAAVHIGVATLEYQADSHLSPPSLRAMVTVLSVALTRYRSPVRCVISPPVTAPGSPLLARNMSHASSWKLSRLSVQASALASTLTVTDEKRWMVPEHSEPVWRRRSGADLVSQSR